MAAVAQKIYSMSFSHLLPPGQIAYHSIYYHLHFSLPLADTSQFEILFSESFASPALTSLWAGTGSFPWVQHPAKNITFVKRNPHRHTVVSSVTSLNHLFPHLKKSLPLWSHPCPETGLCLPSFCILCTCPLICLLINHFCWFLVVHLNALLLSAWTIATQ